MMPSEMPTCGAGVGLDLYAGEDCPPDCSVDTGDGRSESGGVSVTVTAKVLHETTTRVCAGS